MQLTADQQIRLIRHKTAFGRYMLEGTIAHCHKLFTSGMVSEAVEILADFTAKPEQDCYNELLLIKDNTNVQISRSINQNDSSGSCQG